jgi:cephalosporin hydroxylase
MPCNTEGIDGWNSYAPIFAELIERVQPKMIIEVGSWKGASASHMLSLCSAHVFCVDTWEGSQEHQGYLPRDGDGKSRLRQMFDENMSRLGMAERVTALQMKALDGAAELYRRGVQAELVYIDGSHAEEDVAADLRAFWPLLQPGGIMFGDDWQEWQTVRRAVEKFGETICAPNVMGNHWHFQKPAASVDRPA